MSARSAPVRGAKAAKGAAAGATARRGAARRAHCRPRSALRLRRARMTLAGACCLAGVLISFELPVSELVHQRSDLAGVEAQLRATDAENQRLQAEISSLGESSTVAAIAHQDYGLVRPGQLSYVILPSAGAGSSLLGWSKVAAADLVPASVSPYAPAPASPARRSAGLWQRVVQHLEFWR